MLRGRVAVVDVGGGGEGAVVGRPKYNEGEVKARDETGEWKNHTSGACQGGSSSLAAAGGGRKRRRWTSVWL